ncbi:hypothetical protein ACFYZ4_00665 [Streptomyces sp. NPDC001513]|uniref:hypothetical protein n=1 Tax=Streptomyces sp. NPDC001513 TaxID=3364580 RepID=UPI0036B8CBBF
MTSDSRSRPRSAPPRGKTRRLALSAAAVTAIAVAAAGIGYAAGHSGPAADDKGRLEAAGKPSALPFPEITRTSGLSRVKTDSPGYPVKIRPCPGLAPQGSHDCQGVVQLEDGAAVQMWCLQDGMAPEGYPATHKRWFYVIQAEGSPKPGETGWVYSALIPPSEQIRVPDCTIERILEAGPLPPAQPDPDPDPTKAPEPTHAPPSPVPPVTKAPVPTATPPVVPPPATTPPPPPPPARHTVREQSGSHGSPTFLTPRNASGPGERIPAHAWVEVECRVHEPGIETANPGGWWYRIASSPWNGRYYAVANTFMNGDTPGQQPPTDTDWSVPVC